MTLPITSSDPTFRIYLTLSQYPILQRRIRERMRKHLLESGVITKKDFELLVREQALLSQTHEGLHDPYGEEPEELWRERQQHIRDYLTDLYFANNFPFDLFEGIVTEVLAERGADYDELLVTFNPELAPLEMLFEQAFAIAGMPPDERERYEARLQELKVVMIRAMISDQLAYINIAKEWFTLDDLLFIRKHKIGKGKIGGKAAGMLLASSILNQVAEKSVKESVRIPESFFLGADVMYHYMAYNELMRWADQKYKPAEQIRADYPILREEYLDGEFPPDTVAELEKILERVGGQPLIVRSSSLLEDNFGTSFAGKYESVFCPNQASFEENLRDLSKAIAAVYASALHPDALLYRRRNGLQDYDERVAILIQLVQGERHGRYYLPHASGVAFSRNLYRWSPNIKREDGFARLVWGLGTRAVDRVGNDYPRLVALSHPMLRPEASPRAVQRYSQHYVDVIDMQSNEFKTLPVHEVLERRYPVLRYVAQLYQDDFLSPLRSTLVGGKVNDLVITLEEFLHRTPFAERMRRMLHILEEHYRSPVDVEFTAAIREPNAANPEVDIYLLQCRPQSHYQERDIQLPAKLKPEDVIFSTSRVLPHGQVKDIRYVLFVSHEAYFGLSTASERAELGRAISRLNEALADVVFICIGPGRWGTSNPDLGIRIGYGDIYNARALIEVSGEGVGSAPELSFGTHFFQDLIESGIYPLAIYLDDEDMVFNRAFFYETKNMVAKFLPGEAHLKDCISLLDVEKFRPGHRIELVMDDEAGRAVAFLLPVNKIENAKEEREA
jgi:hypothetical protein